MSCSLAEGASGEPAVWLAVEAAADGEDPFSPGSDAADGAESASGSTSSELA
jgi:hypothetical protein